MRNVHAIIFGQSKRNRPARKPAHKETLSPRAMSTEALPSLEALFRGLPVQ